jgi:prepilin-type N-terminal cleavage/methylation domain-containing protein
MEIARSVDVRVDSGPIERKKGMRSRDGFTLTELLIVLILAGIIGGIAMVRVGSMLAQTRIQRAASVVAADLKMAHSLAGRQRKPIRIEINTGARTIRTTDYVTPTIVYSQRYFHAAGEYPVQTFNSTETSLLVYPNGLAEKPVTITVGANGRTRVISMTRAGQVRVSGT